jgi:hypothetical protein
MEKSYTFLLVTLLCLSLTARTQNSSLNFTDSNYVTTGIDVVNPNGDFTLEFWAYVPDSMKDGKTHQMVSEGFTGLEFGIGYLPDSTIQVGDPALFPSTGVTMHFNRWTHIALTFSGTTGTATLYMDGRNVAQVPGFFFTDDQPFRIGVQTDLTEPFTGRIDDMKAWNTPRTPSQVRSDMFSAPDNNDNTLVAWYKMDDGSGALVTNSANSTGNSQDGAITGDSAGLHSWAPSPIQFGNNALTFDGVDDQVNIPAAAGNIYDLAGGGTVEFWVNPTSLGSSWSTVLGNRGAGGVRYSFHLSATQIGLDNGTTINTLDYAVPTGTWTHLAFVMDGANTTTVYVNGTQQGTITGSLGAATGQPLTLGIAKNTSGADDRAFTGGIDEVRIWDTQRAAPEILGNKDITLTGTESGLIGQFSFNQGIAGGNDSGLTTALDNSVQANHGAVTNFALTGTTSNFTLHTLIIGSLPVRLTGFTANRSGNEVVLEWQTGMEENTGDFIVERSTDGKTYAPIGTVAAAGNSNTPRDYSYTDPQPQKANNFYRLKEADLDGNVTYSTVRVVNMPAASGLIWYATGRGSAAVLLQGGRDEPFALFDTGGRLLQAGRLENGRTQLSGLPPGIYFARVAANTITLAIP